MSALFCERLACRIKFRLLRKQPDRIVSTIDGRQFMAKINRRQSIGVDIDGVRVGGCNAVVVQSMTNTDTADPTSTAQQVIQLARAGSELVRVTVNNKEAAAAVPEIVARVRDAGHNTP